MQNKVAGAEMQFARYLAAVECPALKSAYFVMIHYQTWPPQAILVSDWPNEPKLVLSRSVNEHGYHRNLVGIIYGMFSMKIAHFVPIGYETW
jgi:hypothetical protein